MGQLDEIEELVFDALGTLRGTLREEDFVNAKESIDAGEPGLGLDTICSQLHEFGIHIPRRSFNLLADAGKLMKMPEKTWNKLLPLIDEGNPQ